MNCLICKLPKITPSPECIKCKTTICSDCYKTTGKCINCGEIDPMFTSYYKKAVKGIYINDEFEDLENYPSFQNVPQTIKEMLIDIEKFLKMDYSVFKTHIKRSMTSIRDLFKNLHDYRVIELLTSLDSVLETMCCGKEIDKALSWFQYLDVVVHLISQDSELSRKYSKLIAKFPIFEKIAYKYEQVEKVKCTGILLFFKCME